MDNAATGSTLKANNLEVFDTLMNSTTRMYASKAAWENPAKRARIEQLALLLTSVLDARKRLMVTFNCPVDKLAHMLEIIPACVFCVAVIVHTLSLIARHTHQPPPPPLQLCRLKAPTVSQLHGGGYAIQIAADSASVPALIPQIKREGGSDIVVTTIRMLVA